MGHWRSWLARLVDIEEVTGSSPVWPTFDPAFSAGFFIDVGIDWLY